MAGFIFGGNTPWSYDELQRKRAVAESLLAGAGAAPRNVGEGLNAIGKALAYRGLEKRAGKEEARMKGEFDQKWGSVFSGGPAGMASEPSYAPPAPVDPSSPAGLGDDAMAALGKRPIRDYRESLIGTESGGKWSAQNAETGAGGKKGHFGRVQFGQARLQEAMNAGVIPQGTTPEQFMASPDLQMAAEDWHFMDLESQLADLVGREVNGQPMDIGALVAMGHLGGAGGARKFVESGGAYNPADSFGTSLGDYARKHGGTVSPFSGGAPQGSGGMNLGALVDLAGDPMATPAQRAIVEQLIAQQTTAADPMKAIELEKAQLELAQMKDPGAKPVDLETFNGPDGKVYSFNPATGETEPLTEAEQPEPGYRFLTDEEVKANPKLDPNKAWQVGPDNKVVEVGGGGVSVSVGGGETAFDKKAGEEAATALGTIQDEGISAGTGIATLDAMEASMADPNFYSGTGAGAVEAIQRAAVSIGIADPSSVTSMETFGSLAKGAALSAMGGSLGAGFSNADRDFVEKQVPTLGNTPEGNRGIIKIQKAILKRKQELADLAANYAAEREAQGKRFDKAGFQKKAKEFAEANPLFGTATASPTTGGNTTSSGIQWSIEE